MSLREYARHRGCSLSAVQGALADKRITIAKTEQHGKALWKFVDPDLADREWTSNTCVDQQRNPTRAQRGIIDTPVTNLEDGEQIELLPEMLPPPPQSDIPVDGAVLQLDYNQERARREHFAAKSAELDYYREIKTLVHKDTIKILLFNRAQSVQQNLFSIPSRISPILEAYMKKTIEELKTNPNALCTIDKKEIEDIISGELKLVLRKIGDVTNTI